MCFYCVGPLFNPYMLSVYGGELGMSVGRGQAERRSKFFQTLIPPQKLLAAISNRALSWRLAEAPGSQSFLWHRL